MYYSKSRKTIMASELQQFLNRKMREKSIVVENISGSMEINSQELRRLLSTDTNLKIDDCISTFSTEFSSWRHF